MPHPTPAQLVSGSATVVGSALVLLLVVPSGSAAALTLVAALSLALGTLAALATAPERRTARAARARTGVRV
ncbi:hypothetical protein ACL02R_11160 [Streptomyces sp. MS19]|uniref:hypothetical protein n=1 Tax=Streptomyces sp. MS19 TaxID=3385972 RepID=UPI0039A11073